MGIIFFNTVGNGFMRERFELRPPFAVVRSSQATLVEQVAEGLRRAIDSGFYKPGDVLPTTRGLADALGVSRIVTRAAVRELAEAGLINPKPSVGSVVLGRRGKLWRGNILFVSRSNGCIYYDSVFTATLCARLVKAGWLFTQVSVAPDSDGQVDVSELELHLTHPVTLAISMFTAPEVARVLSRSGVPFVTIGGDARKYRGRVGRVSYDRSSTMIDLIASASASGVRTALQVGWEDTDDALDAFNSAGIRTSKWRIPIPAGARMPAAVSFASRDAFLSRLSRSRAWLPDLIYFSDDYVCAGALAAFAAKGVRVGEDVRVATWANLGIGPVFAKELTRLEMDPQSDADKVASSVLAKLEADTGPFKLTLGPVFRRGATL